MIVLSLDLSTHTGYAKVQGELGKLPRLLAYGTVHLPKESAKAYGDYPWSYVSAVEDLVNKLKEIWENKKIDIIVIEETNKASFSRYSQKLLEFIHFAVLLELRKLNIPVYYINTSEWRKILNINLSLEDRKNNKMSAAARKKHGIKGKITKKHLSVRHVNNTFGLQLKLVNNDVADALCLVEAYYLGAKTNN